MATKTQKAGQGGVGRSKPARKSTQSGARAVQKSRGAGGDDGGNNGGSTLQNRQDNGSRQGGLANLSAGQLAQGLGWFSIGLGLAEVLAPRGVAKVAGLPGKHTGFIRLMGLREIAAGVGIFAQGKRPAASVWARVAGDALDLASLAVAATSPDSKKGLLAFATANVLGVTALDVLCAQQLSSEDGTEEEGTQVRKSLIINRAAEELYQFWHDFENLPRIMHDLKSVSVTGEGRSHWVAKGPAGSSVEWDALITEDRPNELISWRSLEGADVDNSGTVRFEPAAGNRGTIVTVEMEYKVPGGSIGAAIAKLIGEEPGAKALESLRCFKQLVETGEVVVSDGTFWDNGLLSQRPAQPLSGEELAQPKSQSAGAA